MGLSVKTMSLKHYLFISIALFVLLLAGAQLFLVNYIQQSIGSEVEAKSRTLSKQAVDVLVENLHFTAVEEVQETPSSGVFIEIKKTPNQVIELDKKHRFVMGDESNTITVKRIPEIARRQVKQQLIKDLSDLSITPVNSGYAFQVGMNSPNIRHQQIVQFNERDSAVSQYVNWLSIMILTLCAIGLFFAYWLARHISRPLGDLSQGFVSLEQGQLGTQVESGGVKEVRETLQRFNHMSARLAQLAELEKRYQQQQQLAELGEISRGLAHTLRNPINTIGLAIEQMAQPRISEEQRDSLSVQVRHKINHLDNTIKALLSLTASGIDRNQNVDIDAVISDIIMELSMSNSQRIQYSHTQNMTIKGAPSEVRTMLHTLLANACEASEQDQTISVFCQLDNDCLEVSVVDQGAGLSPEIKDDLFKPHVSSKPEGAGMGLYIAKRISQSYYHGDIRIEDNQPKGCVATLTLCTASSDEVKKDE